MGFGAPAPGKLTQKTNAKNESQISAKSGAQKLNKNQNADIKCVKKISTRIAGGISLYKKRPLSQVNCSNLYRQHKLEQFKIRRRSFLLQKFTEALQALRF